MYLSRSLSYMGMDRSRQNVLDWDYYTRVNKVASIIHIKQWRDWRLSGVAFEFGNAIYSYPNRSMSTYAVGKIKKGCDRGLLKEVQGFWLDVLIGPYIAFGVECEAGNDDAVDLFHIANEGSGAAQHRHHTVEVALYNLMGLMWEMEVNMFGLSRRSSRYNSHTILLPYQLHIFY